jgi:hypothetical protein
VDDPAEIRRRDWLRGGLNNQRILSQRPVDVLGQGLDSLEGLVTAASKLQHAPRSQLRYLVEQLPRGRTLAELAFAELPQEAKGALVGAGLTTLWRQAADKRSWSTALLDLVEISEIGRLGRTPERVESKPEVAHAR